LTENLGNLGQLGNGMTVTFCRVFDGVDGRKIS